MLWLVPMGLLILSEVGADIFSKEYALKGRFSFWLIALIGYMIANIFWLWSIRSGSELARGATIFAVGSSLVAIIIGIYFYGEVTNKIQIAGMILGALSLILIFWK